MARSIWQIVASYKKSTTGVEFESNWSELTARIQMLYEDLAACVEREGNPAIGLRDIETLLRGLEDMQNFGAISLDETCLARCKASVNRLINSSK